MLERILHLFNSSGKSINAIEKIIGLTQGTISNWKSGKNKPSLDAVSKIADYFGVSVDYLLGKTANNVYPVDSITVFEELGTIRAGFDGSIDECPTGRKVEIPTSMLHGRPATDYFTLRVTGDSMYPVFVDGDTILCLRTDSVDSGTYAVVIYDGDEATVKKVNYVQGEDWLELIPVTFRQSQHTTIYCGMLAYFIQYIVILGKNIYRDLCINSYFVTKICY